MSSSALLERLQADLTSARRAQHKDHVLLLGMVIAEVKNRELELSRAVLDDEVTDVVRKAIKKRRESADLYEKAGRVDLLEKERWELTMLEAYLPAAVDPAEIRAAVVAAIASGAGNIGAVMGQVMPAFRGKVDGSVINAIVREELAGR